MSYQVLCHYLWLTQSFIDGDASLEYFGEAVGTPSQQLLAATMSPVVAVGLPGLAVEDEPAQADLENLDTSLSFLWLEITGKCQLECMHCYADSGPWNSHGSMAREDWIRVIDQAADLGVEMVQFIGGEPTLHPDLPDLINHAAGQGLQVEIYSNLVAVSDSLWEVLSQPGVQLATSYYSDRTSEHEAITKRRGSHPRTLDGIGKALKRGVPIRVGVIGIEDSQRVEEACRQLSELGVSDVGVDHLRQVGRGIRDTSPGNDQLCGNCANGVLAVMPDGNVRPCVFTRWISLGNIQRVSLKDIHSSSYTEDVRNELNEAFTRRPQDGINEIDMQCKPHCIPNRCPPNSSCGPQCPPRTGPNCVPKNNCLPKGR